MDLKTSHHAADFAQPVEEVRQFDCGSGGRLAFKIGEKTVDSFQALNLAFVFVQALARGWLKNRVVMYCDRKLTYRYDIETLILNDLSRSETPGQAKR